MKQKLCTNSTFKILKKANKQSDKKLEIIFLEKLIKNISDSTWILGNGKITETKECGKTVKKIKEDKEVKKDKEDKEVKGVKKENNSPYSFVVLALNQKTMTLKNLYEITFPVKDGKILQNSFKISNSKTGELILSIKGIK